MAEGSEEGGGGVKHWQHDETGRITTAPQCPGPRWAEVPPPPEPSYMRHAPNQCCECHDCLSHFAREKVASDYFAQMDAEDGPDDEATCPQCEGDGGDKWNDYALPCQMCGGDGRLW